MQFSASSSGVGGPNWSELVSAEMPVAFCEGMCDFVRDLSASFPEYAYGWSNIRKDMSPDQWRALYTYCANVYPKAFITIMYECEEDLEDLQCSVNTEFLPHMNFRLLFSASQVTASIKAAVWKYLQLILCIIIPSLQSEEAFGKEMASILETIDEDALAAKLAQTAEGLSDFFVRAQESTDAAESMKTDEEEEGGRASPEGPTFDFNSIPGADEVNDRLHSIMGGKLGQFANELAAEFQAEMANDPEMARIQTNAEMMTYLGKHPRVFASLIHRMSTKLSEKIRNGEMTRGDMKREMDNMMECMNPEELESMLSTMAAAGHDVSYLRETIRRKQMRDRLRKKAFAANLKRTRAPPPAPVVDPYADLPKHEKKMRRREDRARENAELDKMAAWING